MIETYTLNYNIDDINKATQNLTEFEIKREKMILISINFYVTRKVTNIDIVTYISNNTGYSKSIIRSVLNKYESLGYIQKNK